MIRSVESCLHYSPPRRGGEARSAGVVSSAESFAGLTSPSAPSLRLAQPPLLCEEGNALHSYRPCNRPNPARAAREFALSGASDFSCVIDQMHDVLQGLSFE